ncbi:MAG: NRDE family protein [Casimicrobiaceae bacterium]
MCLAVFAIAVHPRYTLVVAANRDEFHARPTSAAHWWAANILAGRDERAGGTWFGVNRQGRFAFVTNVREPGRNDAAAPSRGDLVPRVLADPADVEDACVSVLDGAARYNGFNLVAGDMASANYVSNRHPAALAIRDGVHGLSNAALGDPWPKVVRTRDALSHWCTAGADDVQPLWDALGDRGIADDASLPSTGLGRERERLLSAAFIVDPTYGTRSSTVLTITHGGLATFVERSFDAQGSPRGEVVQRFAVESIL